MTDCRASSRLFCVAVNCEPVCSHDFSVCSARACSLASCMMFCAMSSTARELEPVSCLEPTVLPRRECLRWSMGALNT